MPDSSKSPPSIRQVLETSIYANDLDAAKAFYSDLMGFHLFMEETGRHLFYRVGNSLLFIFAPEASHLPTPPHQGIPIPTHGAHGQGHVAFLIERKDLNHWRDYLISNQIEIETEIAWPHNGHSIYFRDPANNSLEVATPGLWKHILQPSE